MPKPKVTLLVYSILLVAILLPPHVIGIDRFVTIDEPWWVISGSNFYYALGQHEFDQTLYDYHPAVTTTWVVAAGMLSYFPEYRGFGQGYFDVRKAHFEKFMEKHGKQPLDLVRNSRLIQTALIAACALIAFWLLAAILDPLGALLAVVLALNAPFFLGHSRLLNHEGMLSTFMLVSVLGAYVYVFHGRKFYVLAVSAASAALAQLTKSSAIVVLPLFGLMLFIDLFQKEAQRTCWNKVWDSVKTFTVWFAMLAMVYVALWPGMWVAPAKMLSEVYGNAFSYAFQGARIAAESTAEVSMPNLGEGLRQSFIYLNSILLRTTPVSWAGLLLALASLFDKKSARQLIVFLGLTGMLVVFMFGIAKGRDSAHYILSSYVFFDAAAGLGFAWGLARAASRWPAWHQVWVRYGAVFVLLLLQIAGSLSFYPYYTTYYNPIMKALRGGSMVIGYGEGLSEAARYLAQKPDAQDLKAFVFNGMGTFSYFFPGETMVFKKAYLWEPGVPDVVNGIRAADYLVILTVTQKSLAESQTLLSALQAYTPEKIIYINGTDTARMYRTADFAPQFFIEIAK